MSRITQRCLFVLGVAVVALMTAPFALAAPTQYSGQAAIVKGEVLGVPVNVVDTTPLDPSGGAKEACFAEYPNTPSQTCTIEGLPVGDPLGGAFQATALSAKTVGQDGASHSEATTASFSLNLSQLLGVPGLPSITGDALTATADAVCDTGLAAIDSSSQIANLLVDGLPAVLITDADGTFIDLGTVKVYVNQVQAKQAGNHGDVTVRALRIVAPTLNTDLTVGYAHADIKCETGNHGPCGSEKVTGGGWFNDTLLHGGDRVHFTLAAWYKDGLLDPRGHFLYQHKALNLKVRGKPQVIVFNRIAARDGSAIVSGPASANRSFEKGGVGWFVAYAVDNGEPGRSDQFAVVLFTADPNLGGSEVYRANIDATTSLLGSGLDGGNIQYHSCNKRK